MDINRLTETPELDVVRVVNLDSDGKILLVREFDDENWKLPGGKIHAGETIFIALQREMKEELDLSVVSGMITNYVKAHIPNNEHYRHVFALDLSELQPKTTKEVIEFSYFDLNELPETKFREHITTAAALVS